MQIQNPSSDECSPENIQAQDFEQANALAETIQPRDSHPTKTKVKVFKNRVFHLLKILVDKSSNVNPLITCMNQEMFLREPQKMKELTNNILNKQNIQASNLQQLLEFYRVILLYKSHKKSSNQTNEIAQDFLRILKKLSIADESLSALTIVGMLKSFAFERKCTLKINFFFYLIRKYTNFGSLRKLMTNQCQKYLNDQKLRNAQKKQVAKLLTKLDRNNGFVKKQEQSRKSSLNGVQQEDQLSNDQDDIVAVKKQQHNQNQQNKSSNKPSQNKPQNKNKKQVTAEKFQRIKANKKKRNNRPNQKPSKESNNKDSRSNDRSNSHAKKNPISNQKSNTKPQAQHKTSQNKNPQFKGQNNNKSENRHNGKPTNPKNSRAYTPKKSFSQGKGRL